MAQAQAVVAAAVFAAVMLAGCSGNGDAGAPWHGRDLTQPGWSTTTLEEGYTYELVYRAFEGAVLTWDWAVAEESPLEFYVHTHGVSGQDIGFNATVAPEHTGELVVPSDGYYALQWTNLGEPVTLHMRVPAGGAGQFYAPG